MMISRPEFLVQPLQRDAIHPILSSSVGEALSHEDHLTQPGCAEEALQTDVRASLSPSQMVEKKLLTLLRGNALPVSHAQMLYTSMNRR